MPGLNQLLAAPRRDCGGIATLVAIFLTGGVLLGSGALVVDVGRLYAERQELQNGADAAATAIAEECARTPSTCATSAPTLADRYANQNAKDGASTVSVICGSAAGTGLAPCPAPTAGLTGCVGQLPAGTKYVEVRTRTRLSDGSTLLPSTFSTSLLGHADYEGTNVGACARAAWGPPSQARGMAVTISVCEWNQMTSGGTVFAVDPAQGSPPASAEKIIYLHTTSGALTCPAGPSGWNAPGGFGWLDENNGPCATDIDADGGYGGGTGASASDACKTALAAAAATPHVLPVPIYDGVHGTGTDTIYHLAGVASFVLTGYAVPGVRRSSSLTGRHWCSGDEKCLYGYFTRSLLPSTADLGGQERGGSVVVLAG